MISGQSSSLSSIFHLSGQFYLLNGASVLHLYPVCQHQCSIRVALVTHLMVPYRDSGLEKELCLGRFFRNDLHVSLSCHFSFLDGELTKSVRIQTVFF